MTELFSLNLHHLISFHLVAFLDVVVVLEHETTLVSGSYFLHIVLESLQGCQPSVEDHNAVADQPCRAVALEDTILDICSGDRSDSGRLECLAYLRVSEHLFLEDRI